MYDYIKGTAVSKQLNSYRGSFAVIENSGIGWLIFTGKRTLEKIQTGTEVKMYVSLQHREDSMSLTGFAAKEERDVFNILQSVSGIGIKTALAIMDEFSAAELVNIMIREDAKALSKAKGVGAKAAQKIIIELKDKLINSQNTIEDDLNAYETAQVYSASENSAQVQTVLSSLGYSPAEIKRALKYACGAGKSTDSPEDILKYSLEYLSSIDASE